MIFFSSFIYFWNCQDVRAYAVWEFLHYFHCDVTHLPFYVVLIEIALGQLRNLNLNRTKIGMEKSRNEFDFFPFVRFVVFYYVHFFLLSLYELDEWLLSMANHLRNWLCKRTQIDWMTAICTITPKCLNSYGSDAKIMQHFSISSICHQFHVERTADSTQHQLV